MKHQKCSKCKTDKPISEFHKDRSRSSGLQRYCKICKQNADNPDRLDLRFLVYYLPKENYIGMTKSYEKRMRKHRANGKDISRSFILISTKREKLAHLLETILHMFGFKGFRY